MRFPPAVRSLWIAGVYSALDKLSGLGLVDSSLQGNRPYTRYEAARQVDAAVMASRYQEVSPAIAGLIRRLEKEVADTLADLRSGSANGYIKPRQVEISYVYQDGAAASYAGGGVVASQFPLNYNNYGLSYQEQNALVVLAGEARLGSFFLLEARPLVSVSDGDDTEADLSLLDGRAVLQLGAFEISVGRQSLWWGQGRHGSLVLTTNAKPMDMVRLTNPTPTLLPWFFEVPGTVPV